MSIQILAFTDRGFSLAQHLAEMLGAQAARCGQEQSLEEWTRRGFETADALIFVGAAGIAVRAIAPWLRDKARDPAVVVVDETGAFAIPILSGHLGGANDLARTIAKKLGATPVITTATDRNHIFAVDEWARKQGCVIVEPRGIKRISAALLAGDTIRLSSDWPLPPNPPKGLTLGEPGDIRLSLYHGEEQTLDVVPQIAVLGVGCRRGTSAAVIARQFDVLLQSHDLYRQAFCQVCSLNLKAHEPGILEFCRQEGLPFQTFSAQTLSEIPGDFSHSDFVEKTTGVDNVCERSAVCGSGGTLLIHKTAGQGVTLAVALKPFSPDWRYEYE